LRSTWTVQDELALSVPPLKLTVVSPALPVNVPPQVEPAFGTLATCNPEGRISLKIIPCSVVPVFGLVMVKVIVAVPLRGMVVALNALLIVGGPTTVSTAWLLAAPVPPSFEAGPLAVLLFAPAVVPLMLTVSVQDCPCINVPPPQFNVVSPAVAFQVPLQVPPMPVGFATCNPIGRLSAKLIPVRSTEALGLVSVKVSVVVPLSGIDVELNDFINVGGWTTVRVALWLVAGVSPQALVPSTV